MNIKNLSGFSLLEIVIAMLILSLVVAGSFGLFVTNHKFIIEARHRLQAINYARQITEALKVYVSADSNTPQGAGTALSAGTYGPETINIEGTTNATRTYTIDNDPQSATGLKQVTITTTWTEP